MMQESNTAKTRLCFVRRADDRDLVLIGEPYYRFFIKNKRLSDCDGNASGSGSDHRLDRRNADYRHVKSHVLCGFGDLDYGELAFRQLTGTEDSRSVPPRLNGNAGLCPYHNSLPKIQPRDLIRYGSP